MEQSKWLLFAILLLANDYGLKVGVELTESAVSTTTSPWNVCDADSCEVGKHWTHQEACNFTVCNDDACEGGYFKWSKYAECSDNTIAKVFIIIGAVFYMLYLFVAITSVADDFFSPSVSAIVAHLKISESIAGVTFMAFGNGAPDVFGSVASVLSSDKPKADLALGDLLGGGSFVTMMVCATIIMTKPFKAEPFAMTRDIICYLIALGWILFVFMYANQVYIWEPLVYLGIYAIYVVIVFVGNHFQQKRRKARRRKSKSSRGSMRSRNALSVNRANSIVPEIHITTVTDNENDRSNHIETHKRTSITFNNLYSVHPVNPSNALSNGNTLHNPAEEVELPNEEAESSDEEVEQEFVVSHHVVMVGPEARVRAASIAPPPIKIDNWKTFFYDIGKHFRPLSEVDDWDEMGYLSKAIAIIKIPIIFVYKLTIPLNECSWSKSVAIIHAIVSPQLVIFSIQGLTMKPFTDNGPMAFVYMFGVSAIIIAIILIFTRFDREPKYYKEIYSYLGFLMSIAWIYWISAEVVSVVTMLGVVSRIPHEVLGMTILAWSNSIGDLVADISVVKQGYPRMAMSAAIGGPLFNLLVGFGLPFTIAKLQKKKISIVFKPTYHLILLFLSLSLITSLIGLYVQRLYLRRPHAIILIVLYVTFMTFVVLSETNVVVWN